MAFSYTFYLSPTTRTPAVELQRRQQTVANFDSIISLKCHKKITEWTNSESTTSSILTIEYRIDPEGDKRFHREEAYSDFLRYISRNVLTVFCWNADNLLLLGSCQVPLFELLRKREFKKTYAKFYPISNEMKETIFELKIRLTNIGEKEGFTLRKKEVKGSTSHKKVKYRSQAITVKDFVNSPEKLKMPETVKLGALNSKFASSDMEDEYRKSMIISQYKMFLHQDRSGLSSDELEIYRNYSREATLSSTEKKVIPIGNAPRLNYNLGQISVFSMSFQNKSRKTTNYCIFIHDPLETQKLSLVTNVNEWKHLSLREGSDQPSRWNIFSADGQFSLKPNERLPFLVKQHALSPPENHFRQRIVTIIVKNLETDINEQVSDIGLIYLETYVNGEFVLQEPENEDITVTLPAEIHTSKIAFAKFLLCSQEDYRASLGPNNTISIKCFTPSSLNEKEFYVLLYKDMFYYETTCIFKVLLQTYQVFKIDAVAGIKAVRQLEIPKSMKDRKLEIHSSNPKVCRLMEGYYNYIEVPAYEEAKVQIISYPYHIGQSRVYFHIVEAYSREVIQRILIQLNASIPPIDAKYELTASRDSVTKTNFIYINNKPFLRTVEFSTSNPELMQISQSAIAVESNSEASIEVLINPVSHSKTSFVLVYANDCEGESPEIFSFAITFIY